MNTEFFIARHILSVRKGSFSRPVVRIAVLSIALSVMVMIVAVAMVTGFQKEIREKVIGFGAHVQISHYDANNSYESSPVSVQQPFYPSLQEEEGIRHIQVFAIKAGIIKTETEIEGVVLKGVGRDFDGTFFDDKLIEGKSIQISDAGKTNEVLISKTQADRLKLKTGDDLVMYFISAGQDHPGVRKFKVCGIYDTGLEEFDKTYVIGDIRHIQKLNQWDSTMVGGFEVFIDDFDRLDELSEQVYNSVGYDLDARSIRDLYPQIFDWLEFQDVNVAIIIILMIFVSVINMISTLLIIIIEKTNMIGILKSMGSRNWSIRKVFLMVSAYLVGSGLLWGNLIGLSLCLLQKYFGFLTLDPASYYVKVVPVNLTLMNVLLINAGTIIICLVALIVPTFIITRISPVKAIRME